MNSEGYFINCALDIFSAWITGHRGKSYYIVGSIELEAKCLY